MYRNVRLFFRVRRRTVALRVIEPSGVTDTSTAHPQKVIEMTFLFPLILLVVLGLAVRFATDSRDGRDWAPRVRGSGCSGNIVLR